ncbi:MAG: hypothetical protein AABY06_01875 [Nanoarchaeota archaeon]
MQFGDNLKKIIKNGCPAVPKFALTRNFCLRHRCTKISSCGRNKQPLYEIGLSG